MITAYVIVGLLMVSSTTSRDVIEALIFEDSSCSVPLGHIILEANGVCNCLYCSRWREYPTEAPLPEVVTTTMTTTKTEGPSVTSTVVPTGTVTETLETGTVSLTSSKIRPTMTAIPPNSTTVTMTEEVEPLGPATPSPSTSCGPCGFSNISVGRGACHPSGMFLLELPESTATCSDDFTDTLMTVSTNCTPVGDVFALFSNTTCNHFDDDDDAVSALAIVLIIFIVVFVIGIIAVALMLKRFKARLGDFSKLKDTVDKAVREEKSIMSEVVKIKTNISSTTPAVTEQVETVEEVTGVTSLARSLSDIAIGIAAPSLPLREDLDRLSAHMAEVEAAVNMQRQIQLDAMI